MPKYQSSYTGAQIDAAIAAIAAIQTVNNNQQTAIAVLQAQIASLSFNEDQIAETAINKKFTANLLSQLNTLWAAYNQSPNTVSNVTNATANEGDALVHTVTLSASTGGTFSFAIANNTTSAGDFNVTPTFSNGVTLSGGNLSVPNALTSFTVTIASIEDATVETNETYTLTVGGVSATGTIVNDDSTPVMTVSSVSSPTAAEGANLVFTINLSGATQQVQLLPFTVGGTAVANTDYASPLLYSDGVTISGANLSVPIGVSSFSATTVTSTDALTESSETVLLTVGGVTGTGTITDVPPVSLTALTAATPFEAPYGLLSPAQQSAAGSGGYIAIAASRPDTSTTSFCVYTSTAQNGTYTKQLDTQTYNPSVDILNALSFQHESVPFFNEMDLPVTVTSNTIGLLTSDDGGFEFGYYDGYTTENVDGDTSKQFNGVINAIFDTPPIKITGDNVGKLQLLSTLAMIPTLYANGTTVWVKVVPKNGATELDINLVTAVPVTIIGKAQKPLPPREVMLGNLGAFQYFPGTKLSIHNLNFKLVPASRLETPSGGFFAASGVNEAGTTYEIDVINPDGNVIRTITLNGNNEADYDGYLRSVIDIPYGLTTYAFYAKRGSIRSLPVIVDVEQELSGTANVTAASAVLSGQNVQITVSLNVANPLVFSALDYWLGGTVYTTQAFGTITCTNGVTVEPGERLYIPPNVSSFVMTVPTISASGKTLTTSWGADKQFATSTSI